ncbi:hypothetical protein CAPN008_11650 [Capnocytophaga canis]|uniref:hypothetical protein n=1 Tax=Capnocytophaga canis TaxID=1848903 RepID=UPI001AD34724|nr:hypothetical protein [Capnocytophaga canis]GIM61115.1 hypothetical protein CAPN008_11650 [Capnocytophaga canis]
MARSDKKMLAVEQRRRYLAGLREAYADALFHKFMNELSGTLTMKLHKGTWHLVFSCGGENGMVQAKGKTLAYALINLASKSHCFTSKTTAL